MYIISGAMGTKEKVNAINVLTGSTIQQGRNKYK